MEKAYEKFNEAMNEMLELCGKSLFKSTMDKEGWEAMRCMTNLVNAAREMTDEQVKLYERLEKFMDRFDALVEKHGE